MSHTFPAHFSYKEHRPPRFRNSGPHSLVKYIFYYFFFKKIPNSPPYDGLSLLSSATGPGGASVHSFLRHGGAPPAHEAPGLLRQAAPRATATGPRRRTRRPSSHRAARLPVLLTLSSSPWPAHAHLLYDLTPLTSCRTRPGGWRLFPTDRVTGGPQATGARWRGCDWPTQLHDK